MVPGVIFWTIHRPPSPRACSPFLFLQKCDTRQRDNQIQVTCKRLTPRKCSCTLICLLLCLFPLILLTSSNFQARYLSVVLLRCCAQ